jgi:hypothetical protein
MATSPELDTGTLAYSENLRDEFALVPLFLKVILNLRSLSEVVLWSYQSPSICFVQEQICGFMMMK